MMRIEVSPRFPKKDILPLPPRNFAPTKTAKMAVPTTRRAEVKFSEAKALWMAAKVSHCALSDRRGTGHKPHVDNSSSNPWVLE